eukprot:Awhi_evm1s7989
MTYTTSIPSLTNINHPVKMLSRERVSLSSRERTAYALLDEREQQQQQQQQQQKEKKCNVSYNYQPMNLTYNSELLLTSPNQLRNNNNIQDTNSGSEQFYKEQQHLQRHHDEQQQQKKLELERKSTLNNPYIFDVEKSFILKERHREGIYNNGFDVKDPLGDSLLKVRGESEKKINLLDCRNAQTLMDIERNETFLNYQWILRSPSKQMLNIVTGEMETITPPKVVIQRKLFTPFKRIYRVTIDKELKYSVISNIINRNFNIVEGKGSKDSPIIASAFRTIGNYKVFELDEESYSVRIAPQQDVVLILSICMAIDELIQHNRVSSCFP